MNEKEQLSFEGTFPSFQFCIIGIIEENKLTLLLLDFLDGIFGRVQTTLTNEGEGGCSDDHNTQ